MKYILEWNFSLLTTSLQCRVCSVIAQGGRILLPLKGRHTRFPCVGGNYISKFSRVPARMESPCARGFYARFPERGNLRISFSLQKTSDIRFSLYNSFGQHIRTLLDSKHAAGHSDLTFPMDGISQGIYYLRFEVDGVDGGKRVVKF